MHKQILVIVAIFLLNALPASAQLSLVFDPTLQPALPGSSITFRGTLTNQGSMEVFLNGYRTSPIDPALTLDDTRFFTDVPFSLASGASWSGGIFDISISTLAPSQDYMNTFTILGGNDEQALDELANQGFTVRIPLTSSVPEPTSWVGMAIGTVGLLVKRLQNRHKSSRS